MNMEASRGFLLIAKAVEKEQKEKLFLKWLHDSARYEMTFDDYYNEHIPYRKSTEKEKLEIIKKYGG